MQDLTPKQPELKKPFNDSEIGSACSILINPATGLIDGAGLEVDRGLAGYAYLRDQPLTVLQQEPPSPLGSGGGGSAYRRAAWEQVGGFDELLPGYSEDLDLDIRLASRGWRCRLVPAARGMHLGSATFGARSKGQARTAAESRGYILGRYRIGPLWIVTELAVAAVDCLALRSSGPLLGRIRGWYRGIRLPRRTAVIPPETLGWRQAMRRRYQAVFGR